MWKVDVLEDACTFISRGISPKYTEDGGVLVLNQKCIRNHTIDYSLARRHDIEKKNVKPERFIQRGDVLINSTGQGTLGRVAQVREEPPEPTTVDSHVTIVRPNLEKFYLDYFGYALIQIEDELKKSGQGTSGQTELAKTRVQKEFFASYPSDKSEQQRIVAKLDAAFAEIDKAIEICDSELHQMNQLFDALVFERFTKSCADDEPTELRALTKELLTGPFGSALHKSDYVEEGIAVINPQNLVDGKIIPSEGKFITEQKFEELKRYELSENDIVIARRGEMGRCALVPASTQRMICGTGCMILRTNDDSSADFVTELIQSKYVRNALEQGAIGATMLNLNQEILLSVKVQARSVSQQRENTVYIRQVKDITSDYERLKSETIKKYFALKSAILVQELQPPQSEAA